MVNVWFFMCVIITFIFYFILSFEARCESGRRESHRFCSARGHSLSSCYGSFLPLRKRNQHARCYFCFWWINVPVMLRKFQVHKRSCQFLMLWSLKLHSLQLGHQISVLSNFIVKVMFSVLFMKQAKTLKCKMYIYCFLNI